MKEILDELDMILRYPESSEKKGEGTFIVFGRLLRIKELLNKVNNYILNSNEPLDLNLNSSSVVGKKSNHAQIQ